MGGLFGVYNNEPADDFLIPFRQQRSDDQVDSFASSWKVGTSRCRVRNFAVTRPAPSRLCDQLFSDDKSVLRPCFQMVDPASFAHMYLNDLAVLENKEGSRSLYGRIRLRQRMSFRIRIGPLRPAAMRHCELEDGKVMGSGGLHRRPETVSQRLQTLAPTGRYRRGSHLGCRHRYVCAISNITFYIPPLCTLSTWTHF